MRGSSVTVHVLRFASRQRVREVSIPMSCLIFSDIADHPQLSDHKMMGLTRLHVRPSLSLVYSLYIFLDSAHDSPTSSSVACTETAPKITSWISPCPNSWKALRCCRSPWPFSPCRTRSSAACFATSSSWFRWGDGGCCRECGRRNVVTKAIFFHHDTFGP